MDSYEVTQLIIIGILLLLLIFFSSAEGALSSVNKLRIRSLAEDNVKSAKLVNTLIENQSKVPNTILVSIFVINMVISSLITVFTARRFGNLYVGIGVGILTIILLIFGTVIPKTLASLHAEKVSLLYGKYLYLFSVLMTPLVFIVDKISLGIMLLLGINLKETSSTITEDELRSIVEVSHEEGVIESEEKKMITNVVDFGDSLVKDVMIPRIDMSFAEVSLSYDEIVELFSIDKYTRMPVYSETRDNIVGIINLKDIFFFNGSKETFCIRDVMREPYFTYEYKKISDLLIDMRRNYIPLSIVLDEYGATAGLITIEDLLEEIVGEIRDEYDDDEEDAIRLIADNEYLVDGNTKLGEINEVLDLDLESDDYDSIAGHLIYLLDHLPEVGESIVENTVKYTVNSVVKNRIDKVHIQILVQESEENEDDDKK